MKNGKKFTAALTAYAVVAALALPVVANADSVTFSDISNSYAQQAILDLANQGILHGDQGKFNPTGKISRQDFAIILVNALGLKVTTGATSQFGDVAGYAQAYVKAATDAGLISGYDATHFGGSDNLTREQMAALFVRGLHYANGYDKTGKASNLKFSDNNSISSNFKDDVGAAVELGLISGMSDNNGGMMFNPKGNAERQAVALVASKFLTAVKAQHHDLKLTASSTSVLVGQKVTLSVTGTTDAVAWSVDKNGVIDANGNFVGTTAGAATVTAVVDGQTLTQVINVAGDAVTTKVSTVTDMVANGVSEQTVTITAVDANGNPVTNYSGNVLVENDNKTATDFAAAPDQASDFTTTAPADPTAQTAGLVALTNGVGTFVVKTSAVVGATSNYTVSFTAEDDTVHTSVATINTVAQTATSLKLVPTSSNVSVNDVAVNDNNQDSVQVEVLDQTGNPMIDGSFPVHVTVSGPATFDSNSTDPIDTTVDASNATTFMIHSIKGQTGAITLTATSDGLTTATATVNAVVAQDAAKLTIANADSTNTTNAFTEGQSETFNLSTVDANGYNTGASAIPATAKVYVYNTDGTVASNIAVNEVNGGGALTADTDGGFKLTGGAVSNQITVTDTGLADGQHADAGKYTIVVKDTNTDSTKATLASTPTANIVENAASAYGYILTAGATVLPASNPTTTYTAQIVDAYGNPVADSGYKLTFGASSTSGHEAQFNGGILKTVPFTTVTTDANGKATVNFTAQPYNNDQWDVQVADPATTGTLVAAYAGADASTATISVAPAAKISVGFSDVASTSKTTAKAGDALAFTIDLKDQFGNSVAQADTLKAVVSKGVDVSGLTKGTDYTLDANNNVVVEGDAATVAGDLSKILAGKVGTTTVTVSDLSNTSVTAGTASYTTTVGTFNGYAVVDSTGSSVITVAANTPVALTVYAVDTEGNRMAAPASDVNGKVSSYTVTFADVQDGGTNPGAGQFRLTANGSDITDISLQPGATKTVYYVNATAGTYDLSTTNVAVN